MSSTDAFESWDMHTQLWIQSNIMNRYEYKEIIKGYEDTNKWKLRGIKINNELEKIF